ncbi:MAG: HPP family protein [Dehalococcoidia bacterium]
MAEQTNHATYKRGSRVRAARHSWALRWIDPHFTHRPGRYVGQALLAALVLGTVLFAEEGLTNGAIVVAIAGSVAVVFFVPHSLASAPGRIIGGHIFAVIAAYVSFGLFLLLPVAAGSPPGWAIHVTAATSVGLVLLFMTITNTEHSPAAGTALGLATRAVPDGVPGDAVLFIITAAILIAAVRVILGKRLHNLI